MRCTRWTCALLLGVLPGCYFVREVEEAECHTTVAGVCAGVENDAGGLLGSCQCFGSPQQVANRSELGAALAGAPACIQLADGLYGVVEIPNGFGLMGASVEGVVLDHVRFASGSGSACRMTVRGASIAPETH